MRLAMLLGVCAVLVAGAVHAQDVDLGKALKPAWGDLAKIATRLTAYNQHDDAATASYTCCKVRQEKEIKAATKANIEFLNHYADTSFAPSTLMHYSYVASFRPESYRDQEYGYRLLLENYPDSDFANDAAWMLGSLCMQDHERDRAIKVFELLVRTWPQSVWAPAALHQLTTLYEQAGQPKAALDALNALAYRYPKSEFCPGALYSLACRFERERDWSHAIRACKDLLRDFPYSKMADDAAYKLAHCERDSGDAKAALASYDGFIRDFRGSTLANQAMREANSVLDKLGPKYRKHVRYNPDAFDVAKETAKLFDEDAVQLLNNGRHAAAIAKYREFIDRFPGNDHWDDAWFQIGMAYLKQDQLFQGINTAAGPEDLASYQEDYQASTDTSNPIPATGKLSAVKEAVEAFRVIANKLRGSERQCEALGMIARCYTPYGDIDSEPTGDAAYTHQEIAIHFPFNSTRLPWFADGALPVFSLCKLMDWYVNPANWETAQQIYPELSREYPEVFPTGLEGDKEAFYELMGLYHAKTAFAYMEMNHHIKYAMGVGNLLPDSRYFRSAMLMDRGDFAQAASLLQPLAAQPTNELAAQATYLYAQANAKLGRWEEARKAFSEIVTRHPDSGLKDDAERSWSQYQHAGENPQLLNLTEEMAKVQQTFGIDPVNMDVYVGDRCVVFAPHTRAALMRMYNMPNIWDEAQGILRDWAGLPDNEKLTIVVDHGAEATFGNPFKVPGVQIQDPPNWGLGMTQIAANVLAQAIPKLAGNQDLLAGIGYFVASSLQYDLVTETRDTIGSATAVKLPQQEVVNARNAALKALENYIIAGEDAALNRDAVAGMMYSLLDGQGFSKDRLINREPYRAFFAKLKELPGDTSPKSAFAIAAVTAFGDGIAQQLKDWRLPLPKATKPGEAVVKVGPTQ